MEGQQQRPAFSPQRRSRLLLIPRLISADDAIIFQWDVDSSLESTSSLPQVPPPVPLNSEPSDGRVRFVSPPSIAAMVGVDD